MTRRRVLLGMCVLIGLILAAGLGWIWTRPERVIRVAAAKLADARSRAFDAQLAIDNAAVTRQLLGEEAMLTVAAAGTFERQDNAPARLAATVTVGMQSESVALTTEADMRFIDDSVYLLIKKIPPSLTDLAQFKGQWIKLPRAKPSGTEPPPPEKLFSDITAAGFDKVAGRRVRMYKATAAPAAALRLFDSIAALVGDRLTTEQLAAVRESSKNIDGTPVELAITPLSRQLRRIKATFTSPANQNTMRFTFTLTERNENADITAPSDVMTLPQLLGTPAGE